MTAARETFRAYGLEAPMRVVAQQAGVGVATLYRHFPTRTDLVAAVLAERVEACARQMRHALDDLDPWRALSSTVLGFADQQIHDRVLNEALLGSGDAAFHGERRAHAQALDLLVARAQAAGSLRDGIDAGDVRAGLVAIAALRRLPPPSNAQMIGKLADLILAGLRAPHPAHPGPFPRHGGLRGHPFS
ncbi:helix-turn-helix transcriptional regulator [Streptosporangiaceae bacterium NEAU-GS5]|nr:helix-turn-helix transcriptional regulator [Streptosporangiaceae bacterium NEAU-GS5]